MSNIIDSIQLSGVTYGIKGSGGTETIELTQAQYDALVDKDPNVFYIITDAQAGDLTNYYTKSETNTLLGGKADTATTYTKTEVDNAITAATSTKQDTLVSSQNIKTINNTSILGSGNIDIQGGGGGGKAVTGGTNISVTTGETADTINCTLPISGINSNKSITGLGNPFATQNNSTGYYNLLLGYGNKLLDYQNYNYIFGIENEGGGSSGVSNRCQFIVGRGNICKNVYESAFGCFNKNVTNITTGTLFSVGNGTAENARHNAFEIRQNGDIYITSGGTDIKLQDNLGGGGSSYTAGDGIDITNDVISVTGKVDTSAITTSISSSSTDAQVPSAKAVNDKLGGLSIVKLTQAQYDALATKDNSTLYVIIN